MAPALEGDGLGYIILHEMTHIRRRDNLINLIALLICAVNWFNPVLWYALFKFKEDCEISCDAVVLATLGDDERRAYGDTILNIIHMISAPGFMPAIGFAGGFSRRRIVMIAKKKNLSVRWAAAAVIALLLAGCASLPAKSASGPAGQASQSHPSLAALSASSELELNNMVSTKALSINTPASWGYEIAPDGGVNFKRNADYDIGGIYLQPYNSADGQYILTLLPNHSEVTCRKALSGFYTGAEEIDLTTTQPAAAGAPDPLYWTYIFIEDKNNNVIFELFFNKAYASETDAVAVAKTLKCVSAPADSNAPNDNNFDNFVGFVNNYGYKILTNSLTGGYALQIPGSFSAVKNGYAIGKFLEARNGLSKQYGLDFSSYIGKTLTLYTCDGEMRDNGDSALTEDTGGPGTRNIVGLFDGSRLVGFWAAPQAAAEKTNEDWEILNRYLGTGAQ